MLHLSYHTMTQTESVIKNNNRLFWSSELHIKIYNIFCVVC